MSFINPAVLAKSFDKVTAKSEVAFLREREKPKMDYSDPSVCPYCRKPMVRSTIRTYSGVIEPVYLCKDDRAVGVVPDSEIGG